MKKLKPPEIDVMLRLIQLADTPQNLEAMQYIVFQFDFQDYEQFIIEAPPGSIRFNNLIRVSQFYDTLGVLVEGEALDPDVVFELFPTPWNKVEPIIQGMRRELEWPDMFDHFESLGRRYQKWWEERRRRLKLETGEAAPPAARPRVVQMPRPAAPVRPGPARPGAPAARPGAPAAGVVRPAAARPVTPVRPTGRTAALPPRSAAALASSPVARPVAARPAQPQRPAARPAVRKVVAAKRKATPARSSARSRPAAKGKTKSRR